MIGKLLPLSAIFLIFLLAPFPGARVTLAGLPIYGPELVIIFWIGIESFRIRSWTLAGLKPFFLPIALLLLGALMALAVHPTPHGLGIVKSWFVFPIVFAWLVVRETRNGLGPRSVVTVWFAALACLSFASIVTGHATYDGRLTALSLSPNSLALLLSPAPIIGLSLLIERLLTVRTFPSGKESSVLIGLLAGLSASIVAISLTFSYTVWISLLFGSALFWTVRFPRPDRPDQLRPAILLLAGLLILIATQAGNPKLTDWFTSPERSSLASRVMIWKSAARMLADHPLAGIGPGNFQATYLDYQRFFPPYLEWSAPEPHNLFLAFWLESGLSGLIGFLWLIIAWTRGILRSIRLQRKTLPLASLALALMGSVLVQGLSDTPYWRTDLAYSFWITVALGVVALSGKNREVDRVRALSDRASGRSDR